MKCPGRRQAAPPCRSPARRSPAVSSAPAVSSPRPAPRGFGLPPPGDARTLSLSIHSPHQRGLDEGTAHRRRPAPRHRRHHHGRSAVGLGRRGRGPPRAGRLAHREHRGRVRPARAPRTRRTATRRRPPASRSGSCTDGEPGSRPPRCRIPGRRWHARRGKTAIGSHAGPAAAEAWPLRPRHGRRDPRRGDRGSRRLDPRRPAVRDAHQRLAPGRPALLARLRGQPDAPGDGRTARLRHGHAPGRPRPRPFGLQPLRQLPVRDGPGHGPPRDGRGGDGRRPRRPASSTSTRVARRPCAR